MSASVDILSAAGNGDGTAVAFPRYSALHEKQLRTLFVYGTFGGSTVKLQISPDNATWFDVPNADAITSQTTMNVEFRAPWVRGTVSGGTGNSISMKLL
jgi:hypothetical protein